MGCGSNQEVFTEISQEKDKGTGQTDRQTAAGIPTPSADSPACPTAAPSSALLADPSRAELGSAPPGTPGELPWVSPGRGQGQGAPHCTQEGPARARGCTPGCPEHLCPPSQHPAEIGAFQGWILTLARHKTTQREETPEPRGALMGSHHPSTCGGMEGQDKELGGDLGAAPPLSHTGTTPPTSGRSPSPQQSRGAAPSLCIITQHPPSQPGLTPGCCGTHTLQTTPSPPGEPPQSKESPLLTPPAPLRSQLCPFLPSLRAGLSLQRGTGGDSSTFCTGRESCRNQRPLRPFPSSPGCGVPVGPGRCERSGAGTELGGAGAGRRNLGMASGSGNEALELREGSAVPGEPQGGAGHGHLPRWAPQGWVQPPAGRLS